MSMTFASGTTLSLAQAQAAAEALAGVLPTGAALTALLHTAGGFAGRGSDVSVMVT